MKRILLLSITLMTAGFFSTNAEKIPNDSGKETPRVENGNLIVSVEDIKSVKVYSFDMGNMDNVESDYYYPGLYYHLADIEFNNLEPKDLFLKIHTIEGRFFLFLDDKLIFDPVIQFYFGIYSWVPEDLYLDIGLLSENDIFRFRTYFRDYSDKKIWWLTAEEKEQSQKKTIERHSLRSEQYEAFLRIMEDAGKLIDVSTGMEPVATPELNAISIYPNPTSGELRIRNYELGIKDIRIFNMIGNKLSIPDEQVAVGEINISHLPAGIYFLQVTTEKGVVTKKVVKR